MAFTQLLYRILLISAAVLCFDGAVTLVQGCHSSSKELHICLNIYLEKDLPFLETFVKGRRRARVLLEDPDLQSICRHITSLHDCYKDVLLECNTYWQFGRYVRLLNLLQSTYTYLCSNTTDNLKDLLLNTECLTRASPHIADCASASGFGWLTTAKQVLRMQVSPEDQCRSLDYYRSCLTEALSKQICGKEASRVYGNLLEMWLNNWCNKNKNPSSTLKYLFLPATFFN